MEAVAGAVARIEAIRARFDPAAPPRNFQAVLHAHTTDDAPAPAPVTAAPIVVGLPPATVTLGAMTGTSPAPPAPPPPPAGIVSATALDSYLATRGIAARNGRLAAADLVAVSGAWKGTARLLAPAAAAWEAMRAAAAADGIDLRAVDTYRSWETQASAYAAHVRGEKKANVLPPGHSQHGNGLAVDVTNGHIVGRRDPEWRWLVANAGRFGWHPISNETWHWEFRGIGRGGGG